MNKSESIKSLAAALAAAQAEMPSVQMNAVNPFLKNRFADLGAVISTARPVLQKHGLSFSQLPFSEDERIGVTTIIMHSSGEWIENSVALDLVEEKGKSRAQVAGSIITYLRRYSLSGALGMHSDEDTDGNDIHANNGSKTAKVTAPPAPKADAPKGLVSATPQWLVDNGYAENIPNASAILNGLGCAGKSVEFAEPKIKQYRDYRTAGMSSQDAFVAVLKEGK